MEGTSPESPDLEKMVGNKKSSKKVDYTNKCSECGSNHLVRDYKRAELVCGECGLVVDKKNIDYSPDWRNYQPGEDKSRVGPVRDLTGLEGTNVGNRSDNYNRSSRERARIRRLRYWQRRARGAKSNLAKGLGDIETLASKMELPTPVKVNAARFYVELFKKHNTRGRTKEALALGAIYLACRLEKVPLTLGEIAEESGINPLKARKQISSSYNFIKRELGIEVEPPCPGDYVEKYSNELGLGQRTKDKVYDLIKMAEIKRITIGKNPISIVAGAIYLASKVCGEEKHQKDIAEKTGVTEVTIRTRYKEMTRKFGVDISQQVAQAYLEKFNAGKEVRKYVERAINVLKEEDLTISSSPARFGAVLIYCSEMSVREVSDILNVGPSAINSQYAESEEILENNKGRIFLEKTL